MKVIRMNAGFRLDDPNNRHGNPSYQLEPGDPGYVGPVPNPKPKKKGRKNMATNPTPARKLELIASGEDMFDGLDKHFATIGLKKNNPTDFRACLDALITTDGAFKHAESLEPDAYTLLRTADSNTKGFIAAFIKVVSLSYGNEWNAKWIDTSLPDNKVGMPRTQDKRFGALGGMQGFFTRNPGMELTSPKITVTAALAGTLYQAHSDARKAVGNALSATAAAMKPRDAALEAFRAMYRSVVDELDEILDDDDPRWYDFGLSRPADGDQPGIPMHVVVTVMGGGKLLVQCAGARCANSFNFYRKIIGTDTDPVEEKNQPGTTYVIESMPVGATVECTVTAVNDAGEGHPSTPISVVVT